MRSCDVQLPLFVAPATPLRPGPAPVPPKRRRRSERMVERLLKAARAWDREAESCRRSGDALGERRARQEAADARRAAALLRAGPAGVADVLAS